MIEKKYLKIAKEFENMCGFDVVNLDSCKDDLSASIAFMAHVKWFLGWAEEITQHMEKLLMKEELYGLEDEVAFLAKYPEIQERDVCG